MNLTNKHKISLAQAILLAHSDYDYDDRPNAISATSLIKPIKEIILSSQLGDLVKEADLTDMAPSSFGSAVHGWAEMAWRDPDTRKKAMDAIGIPSSAQEKVVLNQIPTDGQIPVWIEKRSERPMGSYVITGKFDGVIDGHLFDYKTCSVWKFILPDDGMDYILQGSIYRWLNPDIITSDELSIEMRFTDWSASNQRTNKDYPPLRLATKKYQLIPVVEIENWIREKVSQIESLTGKPESDLPRCEETREGLWMTVTKYKVFKTEKSTRAINGGVFDTSSEASARQAEKGGIIKIFPGVVKRCIYCNALPVCKQAQEYVASGQLEL